MREGGTEGREGRGERGGEVEGLDGKWEGRREDRREG